MATRFVTVAADWPRVANLEARRPAYGITPAELAARSHVRAVGRLAPRKLQRWLVSHQLATVENGVLVPTALGMQVGGSIRSLEGA